MSSPSPLSFFKSHFSIQHPSAPDSWVVIPSVSPSLLSSSVQSPDSCFPCWTPVLSPFLVLFTQVQSTNSGAGLCMAWWECWSSCSENRMCSKHPAEVKHRAGGIASQGNNRKGPFFAFLQCISSFSKKAFKGDRCQHFVMVKTRDWLLNTLPRRFLRKEPKNSAWCN